ncbi:MAG: NAD(P)H-hydrate dehydratase [Bacteroidetes bacterium]|nr:NAD(P)H-hydrate dehydratase [Bacteroidota bacterium]
MQKVLTINQIRQADTYTIDHEPISSAALMERAATRCYEWIAERVVSPARIMVFCGMGNNGGDGLVIARRLAEKGIKVEVIIVRHTDRPSEDHIINLTLLEQQAKAKITRLVTIADFPYLKPGDVIIDALLGSGISKAVTGFLGEVIRKINQSDLQIIAIDVPSGLFCDEPSDPKSQTIICASQTLTFEVPRLAFLFPENHVFTGEWTLIPIGLNADFIDRIQTTHFLTEMPDIQAILKPRSKFAHKGNFGHGLLIAGSYGKMGAAILGTTAALRSGAGLVTTHIPRKGYDILQTAVPEGMASIDPSENCWSAIIDVTSYDAIAAGPGIGTSPETSTALKVLIQNSPGPLILDADALNILGENKTWLSFLPKKSILTPHMKEFERLAGKTTNSFDRNKVQREFSMKYHCYVILKGAFTCISFPDGRCFFNPTGNPGMATGGSGDVLTGILLGILSQGYHPSEVCLLGTYLHGLAGDLVAENTCEESLIAGDLVEALPNAFQEILSA